MAYQHLTNVARKMADTVRARSVNGTGVMVAPHRLKQTIACSAASTGAVGGGTAFVKLSC